MARLDRPAYNAHIADLLTVSTLTSRSYHHGDLRSALFAAALDLLAADGADALSLRAVARRAGVSAMAPYRHYADKDALLSALAIYGFQRLRDALQESDRDAAPSQALVAQAVAYVSFASSNPALFRLMFGPKRRDPNPDVAAAGEAAYSVLSTRVAAEWTTGEDQATRALGCWAMVHGLAGLFLDNQVSERIAGQETEVTRRVAEVMLGATRSLTATHAP